MHISEHLFHSDQHVRYPMSEFPGFWAKRASSLASVVRSVAYSCHVVFLYLRNRQDAQLTCQ